MMNELTPWYNCIACDARLQDISTPEFATPNFNTVLRFVFKVAVLWSISKTETQNMTFLSHMPSSMLVYALNSI